MIYNEETEEKTSSQEEIKVEPKNGVVPVQTTARKLRNKSKKSVPIPVIDARVRLNQLKINLENQQLKDFNQRTSRSPSLQVQQSKEQSVELLKQLDSNSFEYNIYRYEAGNHDVSLKKNLIKAQEIQPNDNLVLEQMVGLNEIEGNIIERNKNIQQLVSNGKIDLQLVDYAHNLVQSCDVNSFLITHAVEDSYPTMLKSKDKNIEVISLELLQSSVYREKLKKKGIQFPTSPVINTVYFQQFSVLNQDKNIQYSLTIPKEYLQKLNGKIYVQGLTIKNSKKDLPNNLLKTQDLLDNQLIDQSILRPKSDKIKKINANYLPMLLMLRKEAKLHEPEKLERIQRLIDKIISYNKSLGDKVK